MNGKLDYELTLLALEKYVQFQTDLANLWQDISPDTYNEIIHPVLCVREMIEKFGQDSNAHDLVEAMHELGEDNTEMVIHFFNQEGLMGELIKIELELFKDILDEDGDLEV
jgi:hypothetical protein